MILLIDNYDSFTWNLVQRIGELDRALEVRVERNDRISVDDARALSPSQIIVSPGPGAPDDAGVSSDIIRAFAGDVPILGVCLGHQCIGAVFGMGVQRHPKIMHGKTSEIHHDGESVFAGLPSPFTATRYHSLIVARDSVPAIGWSVSAWTQDELPSGERAEVVMGLRRIWSDEDRAAGRSAPLEGVQFHPESFLTDAGHRLLANFLEIPFHAATRPATNRGVQLTT